MPRFRIDPANSYDTGILFKIIIEEEFEKGTVESLVENLDSGLIHQIMTDRDKIGRYSITFPCPQKLFPFLRQVAEKTDKMKICCGARDGTVLFQLLG